MKASLAACVLLALLCWLPIRGQAQVPTPGTPPTAAPRPLPAMYFISSVAEDDMLAAFKADPAFAALDGELAGSPLILLVTHTVRPAPGSEATSAVSAFLSGSTLGLIPVMSKENLVVRYEVQLNGKRIAEYSFEYTGTRSINIWAPDDGHQGLGKAGMEWVKSTAAEAARKLAQDPALRGVAAEIDFYFPPAVPGAG